MPLTTVEGTPPPETLFRHPHCERRRPPRAHAAGPVLGPHPRTDRTRDTRFGEPRLPAPEDGPPGEGQRLTPDAPHNGGRPPPPGDGPPPPPGHAAPTGQAGQGDSVGPPHPHTRARSTWVADPNSPPSRRAVGGGGAPDHRRPSQRLKAAPLGTPFRHPHSEQRRPARAHAAGPVLGPHARTDRTPDTRVAGPRPPAPKDGRPGERQRLTPDAPHNSGRPPPPRGRPPAAPAARSPHRACRPRGQFQRKTGSSNATIKKNFLPAQRCTRDTRISIFAPRSAARAHFWLLVTVSWSHISIVYHICCTQWQTATIAVGQ